MGHMTQQEYEQGKKDIRFTTIVLAIVTVLEVGGSIVYEHFVQDFRMPLIIFVVMASVIKAYYIMKIFMHVGHERKGFIFTILFPFVFLVWAIVAFGFDGAHWMKLREALNGILF